MLLLSIIAVLHSVLLCIVCYRLAALTKHVLGTAATPAEAPEKAQAAPAEQEAPISFVSGSEDVDDEVITTVMTQEDLRKFNGLAKAEPTAATTTPTLVSEGIKKSG